MGWKHIISRREAVFTGKILLVCLWILTTVVVISMVPTSFAVTSQSSNYAFTETSLGGVGVTNTHSSDYKASSSGGIIGFGTSADASLQIKAGHETTNDPA